MFRSLFLVLTSTLMSLYSATVHAESYPVELAKIAVANAVATSRTTTGDTGPEELRGHVRETIERLFAQWEGTTWGLGSPQTSTPGRGKINCGTFVGTVLSDSGFVVNHRKLQRQPSELIIKSVADSRDIRRFRNRSMEQFLEGVRAMGEGLYIIGLDYHVGFLAVNPTVSYDSSTQASTPGKWSTNRRTKPRRSSSHATESWERS